MNEYKHRYSHLEKSTNFRNWLLLSALIFSMVSMFLSLIFDFNIIEFIGFIWIYSTICFALSLLAINYPRFSTVLLWLISITYILFLIFSGIENVYIGVLYFSYVIVINGVAFKQLYYNKTIINKHQKKGGLTVKGKNLRLLRKRRRRRNHTRRLLATKIKPSGYRS